MIAKQLKLNNLKDNVRILEAAIGDMDGTIEMLSAGIYSDGYYRCEAGRDKRELTRVPVTTVDHLAEHFDRQLSQRSEEHTSELQSRLHLVCRLLLEKKKNNYNNDIISSVAHA